MDDLLPILIVVVISLVGSAMRKAQKKRTANNPTPNNYEPQNAEGSIFDWLEKINNNGEDPYQRFEEEEELEEIVEEPVVVETKTETTKYKSPFANYSGFISPEEKSKLVQNEGPSKHKKHSLTSENEIGKEPVKKVKSKQRFDLRQAVIHSIVLNKKYH